MLDLGVLYPGTETLEIGAGSGIATRRLLELGAHPLVAIEPDGRFQQMLSSYDITLLTCSFEEADLASDRFDLVASATAFHWLKPETRVQKLASVLKTGGCTALFWNIFHDPNRIDHFDIATKSLLSDLAASPSGSPASLPFALDRQARVNEFLAGGWFEHSAYQETHWTLVLDPDEVRSLYSGFSSISRLSPERQVHILDALAEVAERRFRGRVERNMTSVIYIFRRV
jgi:SAM-dependent methyltransferase